MVISLAFEMHYFGGPHAAMLTPGSALKQGLLLEGFGVPCGILGIGPGLAVYKANTIPAVGWIVLAP